MKHTPARMQRITCTHLNELDGTASEHPLIQHTIDYHASILSKLKAKVASEPGSIRAMATETLDCLMFGMRNEFSRRAPVTGSGIWDDFVSRFGVVHPIFDNDAFAIYMGSLFDASHNLPAIIKGTCCVDPVAEIATTLAWLQLLPSTRTATEIAFERLLSVPATTPDTVSLAA